MSLNDPSLVDDAQISVSSQKKHILEHCLSRFRAILPPSKYDEIITLTQDLQTLQISREEFDKRYFRTMIPYVIPKVCPPEYIDGNLPSFTLDEDTKKKFLNFFNLPLEERDRLLDSDPDLIPIFQHFIYLLKSRVASEKKIRDLKYMCTDTNAFQNMTYNELSKIESLYEKLLSHVREIKRIKYQEK